MGYVATGVDADFAASAKGDKLYRPDGLLKNEYLPGAAWFTRRSSSPTSASSRTARTTTSGSPRSSPAQPETIMGYPVARMEDMPAKASGSFSLAFGNLKEAYQIVDRRASASCATPTPPSRTSSSTRPSGSAAAWSTTRRSSC
jgi:HK97 family phage major capsid protein